ncbi:MAG: hypothetical protein ACETWR_06890, partial [Anaerolineae bacterium]
QVVKSSFLYHEVKRGISLGCPLSPLMGALYLHRLDERICVPPTGMIYCQTDVQGFHRMGQRGCIVSGEIIFFITCLSD